MHPEKKTLFLEVQKRPVQSSDHFGHPVKMKGVDRVGLQVVVHVPEEGGIRDHNGPEPMMPEGIVVGKIDATEELRGRQRSYRDPRISSDSSLKERDVFGRTKISNDPDVVSCFGIEKGHARKGIPLNGLRTEISDHLQGDHRFDRDLLIP